MTENDTMSTVLQYVAQHCPQVCAIYSNSSLDCPVHGPDGSLQNIKRLVELSYSKPEEIPLLHPYNLDFEDVKAQLDYSSTSTWGGSHW
jgi:hypothetical protein